MAVILSNEQVADDIFLMKAAGTFDGIPGQFYMLKASDTLDPFLKRPISIHDLSDDSISFLYQRKGVGTTCLSHFKTGDTLAFDGPFGNGFRFFDRDAVMIGGGIGIAPMYYALKSFKEQYPKRHVSVYLGFSAEAYRVDDFKHFADSIIVDVGGKITDRIDFTQKGTSTYYACGPDIMLQAVSSDMSKQKQNLWVSLEAHMACGVGACLGCAVQTVNGMRRVCKDGPVFNASEVFV